MIAEVLKSVRAIHRLLLALCAATVVFAASPRPGERYERALDEIRALRELEVESYDEFVKERIDSRYADFGLLESEREVPALRRPAAGAPSGQPAAENRPVSLQAPFVGHLTIPPGEDVRPSTVLLTESDHSRRLVTAGGVDDWIHALDDDIGMVVFEPAKTPKGALFVSARPGPPSGGGTEMVDLSDLLKGIQKECASGLEWTQVVDLSFKRYEEPLAGEIDVEKHKPMYGERLSEAELKPVDTTPAVSLHARCTQYLDRHGREVNQPWSARRHVVPEAGLRAWLGKSSSANVLFDGSTWLSGLRGVWNLTTGMDLATAARTLEQRLATSKREIQVFGISVEEKLALVVSPIALCLSLLYLLAHLKHLRSVAAESAEELAAFPWMGLFRSRLSAAVTHLSVTLLPTGATLWLVLATDKKDPRLVVLSGLITVLVAALGLLISREILHLRADRGKGMLG